MRPSPPPVACPPPSRAPHTPHRSAIEATLRAGTAVVCDRYAFSGIAFSHSKSESTDPAARTLTYEWCRAPDAGLPAPDLTLFLDVPPAAVRARGGFGDERYERADVQARVRAAFERIGEEMGEGVLREGAWAVVEAERAREEVAEAVWEWVRPLAGGTARPLQRLWDETESRETNQQLYI